MRECLLGCATVWIVLAGGARAQDRDKAPPPAWSYEGPNGPSHWGDLSPQYAACKLGKDQSPIDIRNASPASLPALRFDYRPGPLKLINNGHTVQINYPAGSLVSLAGERYNLTQFHFHEPAEERIDGRAAAMVLHLVHSNSRGEVAVVAVPLQIGAADPSIERIWTAIPKTQGREETPGVEIDASKLLPANLAYYTYRGSLTTPPCTEGVTWIILKTPLTVSAQQAKAFGSLFPANARPVQVVGSRVVQVSR